jgi:hypothetical protein
VGARDDADGADARGSVADGAVSAFDSDGTGLLSAVGAGEAAAVGLAVGTTACEADEAAFVTDGAAVKVGERLHDRTAEGAGVGDDGGWQL